MNQNQDDAASEGWVNGIGSRQMPRVGLNQFAPASSDAHDRKIYDRPRVVWLRSQELLKCFDGCGGLVIMGQRRDFELYDRAFENTGAAKRPAELHNKVVVSTSVCAAEERQRIGPVAVGPDDSLPEAERVADPTQAFENSRQVRLFVECRRSLQ
jgi:hypothetical protein